MRRPKQSREMDERFARFEAEDRALAYLTKFTAEVALATARSVELSLATSWEGEQREMIRQGDPRVVFRITPNDMQKLHDALAEIPPGVKSNEDAERHLFDLLSGFPPDQAWLVAHKVAGWEAVDWYRLMFHVASAGGGQNGCNLENGGSL
jgi:hypothetical protein